jgi:hypothetical protein
VPAYGNRPPLRRWPEAVATQVARTLPRRER